MVKKVSKKNSKTKLQTRFRKTKIGSLILATAGIVIVVVIFGTRLLNVGKILPGVWVGDIYVGGMSKTAAQKMLEAENQRYLERKINIGYKDTIISVNPSDIAMRFETAETLNEAAAIGRDPGISGLWNQVKTMIRGRKLEQTLTLDGERLADRLFVLADRYNNSPQNPQLKMEEGKLAYQAGNYGERILVPDTADRLRRHASKLLKGDVSAVVVALRPNVYGGDEDKILKEAEKVTASEIALKFQTKTWTVTQDTLAGWVSLGSTNPSEVAVAEPAYPNWVFSPEKQYDIYTSLDLERVKEYLAKLAEKDIDRPAKDAQVSYENGQLKVIVADQDGRKLDQNLAYERIVNILDDEVRVAELPITVAKADIRADALESLGIKELISRGESNFAGSTKARISNIRTGYSRFKSKLIKPGEVFSFNTILGPVSAETGYLPELVILSDRQEKQYGGGLCQVSSTVFRAALNAGLPIVSRVNHSFAVKYYGWPYDVPGLDATIYLPSPDFKFKNDTSGYILMQPYDKDGKLYFDFYGTKTKEGRINPPKYTYGPDEKGFSKTQFTRDVIVDGKVVETNVFNSSYQPQANFKLVEEN